MPEADSTNTAGAALCVNHPNLRAAFVCGVCHRPICGFCAFSRADGSRICPECASSPATHGESTPPIIGENEYLPPRHIEALKCVQHPHVSAVNVCKVCSAPMCAVCDFLLPGNVHICPRCVSAPPKRMARARKITLVSAYVFAAYNTLGMAFVMSGALAGVFRTEAGQALLGIIFSLFLFIPSLIGAALGISCIDKRLRNPLSVWIVAIWSCLLLGIHLALVVIGNFRT